MSTQYNDTITDINVSEGRSVDQTTTFKNLLVGHDYGPTNRCVCNMSLMELGETDIQNVYLYIGDAVRSDSVLDKLLQSGLAVKSIALGIHSPTSLASIVSGTCLPQHGVGQFRDEISDEVPNLLHTQNLNTAFINSINNVRFDPEESESVIVETLDTSLSSPELLDDIGEPFFIMERGPGGHAPYVRRSEVSSGREYFESRSDASKSQFRQEYNQAVSEDVEWFFSRIDELDDRGILDDTLIIYTSDHGELLGEEGMVGHSLPIHPKHVYVPTVFIHPNLPSVVKRESLVRHVDLAPTILSLIGSESHNSEATDGRDLTERSLATRGATFHRSVKSLRSIDVRFESAGAWDRNGGYVLPETGRIKHALLGLKRLLRIPWRGYARRHLVPYFRAYLRGDQVHGTPGFSKDTAKKYVSGFQSEPVEPLEDESVDVPKERLEQLGYLE